jgi:fructokinase
MLVAGVGEILWDRLPAGAEAGGRAEYRDEIGGGPFNVVSHLARLGYRAAYLTAVGQDEPGTAAITEMTGRGVSTALVGRVDGVPTGLAQVTLGPDGSPAFQVRRPAAFEQWASDESVAARVAAMSPAVLVFGTLAQLAPRARGLLARITAALPAALRLYDVNLRDGWWSADVVTCLAGLASVVKVSESEARELAPMLGVPWGDEASQRAFSDGLAARLGLRGVAITAGPDPASLWLDGDFARAAPPHAEVSDAVGAGDAFTAGLLDAIGQGLGAPAALRRANALGALVASRRGAQPHWTAAELASLESEPPAA